ncbi:hypothetical protein MMC12_003371 [Toensbergia leucococca]|nr:hypothetical protein [Toensbergia leucococca]
MEDLDLEVLELANDMAIGLAILHWQARVDGMDVEFVLGSSATWDRTLPTGYEDESAPPHKQGLINFKRGGVHLWMFDFDKANRIEFTDHDVNTKLVPAFLGNDPYYPRPHVDKELWDDFCGVYLKASEAILRAKGFKQSVMGLPQRLLNEVLRVLKEHEG